VQNTLNLGFLWGNAAVFAGQDSKVRIGTKLLQYAEKNWSLLNRSGVYSPEFTSPKWESSVIHWPPVQFHLPRTGG
jgi:hypothetical protein